MGTAYSSTNNIEPKIIFQIGVNIFRIEAVSIQAAKIAYLSKKEWLSYDSTLK